MNSRQEARFKWSRIVYYLESLNASIHEIGWQSVIACLVFPGNDHLIRLKTSGLVLKVKTILDILVIKEVLLDREYGHTKGKIIVDVGAGFGDFSFISAVENPKATVYAFEPDGQYQRYLREGIARNKLNNVRPIEKTVRTLVAILKQTKRPVDFLKIDCEGCEFDLFRNVRVSDLRKIKTIAMEYHEFGDNNREMITSKLLKARFTVRVVPRKHVPCLGMIYAKRKK